METSMAAGKQVSRSIRRATSTLAGMFGSHKAASTGLRGKARYRAIGGGEICGDFYGGKGHLDFCGDRAMLELYRLMAGTEFGPLR